MDRLPDPQTILTALPIPTALVRGERIIHLNESLLALLDATPDSLVGRSLSALLQLEAPGLVPPPQRGQPGVLIRPDGERVPVLVHDLVMGDYRLLSFSEDAERRMLWRRLIQSERTVQLSELASASMHEIKNLLVVVTLAVSEADEALSLIDTALARQLGEARAGLQRLRELLHDPLGTQESAGGRPDLAARRAVALARRTSMCDIQIHEHYETTEPSALSEGALLQLSLNLLLNAIRAVRERPPGQRVIHISVLRAGDLLELEIRDSGPGFPPAVQEKVFQRRLTTHPKGTGLGLLISRVLARSRGGELTLQSSDTGTIVRAQLPLRRRPTAERRAAPRHRAPPIGGLLETGDARTPVALVDCSEVGLRVSGSTLEEHPEGPSRIRLAEGGELFSAALAPARRAPGLSGEDRCFRILEMSSESQRIWRDWLHSAPLL